MRSLPVDAPASGEITTPNEANAEFREITGAMHDLDADHFATARIAASKLAPGAFGNVYFSTFYPGGSITQHFAGSSQGQVYNICNESGGDWIIQPTTADCSLQMSLGAYWETGPAGAPMYLWIGIRFDGQLVAQSPMQPYPFFRFNSFVRCQVPCPSGTHLIEPVYGIHEASLGVTRNVQWLSRDWSGIEVLR
ncbi:MAG TPA: hypothetical protein VI792_03260 [Candidatus Eisenbacteria bacterium]